MSEQSEEAIRWKRIGEGHYQAGDWHVYREGNARGSLGVRWELHHGPRENAPMLDSARRREDVTRYLQRRAAWDRALDEAESRRYRRFAPVGPKPETVEIPGIDRQLARLHLEPSRDDHYRRQWVVSMVGHLFNAGGVDWHLGLLVEGIAPSNVLLDGSGYFQGDDLPIDEGVSWDHAWTQYWRGQGGRDYRDHAIRLAHFVMRRGAIYMARDCLRRQLYTNEQRAQREASGE